MAVNVPLPTMSTKLLGLLAWVVLFVGLLASFWTGFLTDGPDDFTNKVALAFDALVGWALVWAVLLVATVLASRHDP